MGLEMLPINKIQNLRVATGKAVLMQFVKEGVVNLYIEYLLFEIALFRGVLLKGAEKILFQCFCV